jgi:hypothetical protein
VGADNNVAVQTLVDALVQAYQEAAAQDVAEGLITEAQAAARNRNLVGRVTQMISQPGGMLFGFGGRFSSFEIGGPGRGEGGRIWIERRRGGDGSADEKPKETPADATEATPTPASYIDLRIKTK